MNATVQTSGSLFVSYSIQCVLYGALCIQAYLYYLSFPKDSGLTKSLVSLLCAVITVQIALKTHDILKIYVQGFTEPNILDYVLLAWLSVPVTDGLVACAVQLFFSYRIWMLTRSQVLVALPVTLAFVGSGAAIATGIIASKFKKYSDVHGTTVVSTALWTAASATCDIIVALTLSYHYYRRRNGQTMRSAPLAFLVSMLMETGAITAFTATVELFIFFKFPGLFIGPVVILAVLYANSCMAILNSRIVIAGGREESDIKDVSISSTGMARHRAAGFVKRFVDVTPSTPRAPTVQIQTEVWGETISMSNMKRSPVGPHAHGGFDCRDEENISSE